MPEVSRCFGPGADGVLNSGERFLVGGAVADTSRQVRHTRQQAAAILGGGGALGGCPHGRWSVLLHGVWALARVWALVVLAGPQEGFLADCTQNDKTAENAESGWAGWFH